ncbi:MAG: acetate kinase, partial [Cytophagales bacterium]|nr:acetate kinase [Armatimonadota bacterium]
MAVRERNILVMNAGSSSQKCCLYRIEGDALLGDPPAPLWKGKIEWSAPDGARLTVLDRQETLPGGEPRGSGVSRLLETLWHGKAAVIGGPGEIAGVGHRVVHGGSEFQEPTRITPAVKEAIARLSPLAPAHNPAALEGIEAAEQLLGRYSPQVAVFDTAFHRTLPDAAAVYPGPHSWLKQGIRRYGFHGINHAWCTERAVTMLPDRDPSDLRLICCHLGNGCSLAAVRGGRCMDTTMGFTPLEGLMMGSRSGSIDPGVLLYLLEAPDGPTAAELGHILNTESGLKGLSGVSEDLRAVVAARDAGDARARLAWEVYIHRLRAQIGAMAASLGGLDVLVFTAGVGENSAAVRSETCAPLGFLGLFLNEQKNHAVSQSGPGKERDISRANSRVRVLVIPA